MGSHCQHAGGADIHSHKHSLAYYAGMKEVEIIRLLLIDWHDLGLNKWIICYLAEWRRCRPFTGKNCSWANILFREFKKSFFFLISENYFICLRQDTLGDFYIATPIPSKVVLQTSILYMLFLPSFFTSVSKFSFLQIKENHDRSAHLIFSD